MGVDDVIEVSICQGQVGFVYIVSGEPKICPDYRIVALDPNLVSKQNRVCRRRYRPVPECALEEML